MRVDGSAIDRYLSFLYGPTSSVCLPFAQQDEDIRCTQACFGLNFAIFAQQCP